jgi:broad specificity phosphatase PhoE
MIWLVRHGESEGNAGAPTSDYATIRLTSRGQVQAQKVAALCPHAPDRVIVSPFLRTHQTAAPLLTRFPQLTPTVLPIEEFTYLALPTDHPLTPAERRPLVAAYWDRLDPFHQDGPQTETFAAFLTRARVFVRDAVGWRGWTVVFTHDQFIRAVLQVILCGAAGDFRQAMTEFLGLRSAFTIQNTSITKLEWRADEWWLTGISGGQ